MSERDLANISAGGSPTPTCPRPAHRDHVCPRDAWRPCWAHYQKGHWVYDANTPCWVCDTATRAKYAAMLPYLPGLYDWLDNGGEDVRDFLYDHFCGDMPYGTQKARDGDPDQWLADHPERVEELIGDIEYWCLEEKSA